jgi:hypothetical protein
MAVPGHTREHHPRYCPTGSGNGSRNSPASPGTPTPPCNAYATPSVPTSSPRAKILQACARLRHRDVATTLRNYAHVLPLNDEDVADLYGLTPDDPDQS